MWRKLLQNAALLCVSAVVSLVLLEVALRFSGRFPTEGLHSVSASDYARIPGLWEPSQDYLNRAIPALPHHIHTNALGLRGPETTLEPHGPRVLVLGDSFTFGDFVNDDETLPALLGARLDGTAEVLNGGVGGTTIVDQRRFMERYLVLQPDVVVLLYFDNDLEDLRIDPPMHVWFERNRKLKSGLFGPVYLLLRDTATFNALLHLQGALRAMRAPDTQAEGVDPAHDAPPWLEDAVLSYASEVASLRDMLGAHGIPLVVAAFPHPFVVTGKYQRDFITPLSRELARIGIPVIDLTPALRASGLGETELFLFPHDGHASRRGYAIAAEAIEPRVREALAASLASRASH